LKNNGDYQIMGPGKDKIDALEKKMKTLGIRRNDIEEKFIKASGRGGQKVNKSSSAVFLRHKQTNICVKCGKARSQHLNRFLALRTLVDKIEAHVSGRPAREEERIRKIRKQKKTRKRRARRKVYDSEST
jgi:protein subunit release factor B